MTEKNLEVCRLVLKQQTPRPGELVYDIIGIRDVNGRVREVCRGPHGEWRNEEGEKSAIYYRVQLHYLSGRLVLWFMSREIVVRNLEEKYRQIYYTSPSSRHWRRASDKQLEKWGGELGGDSLIDERVSPEGF